MSYTFKKGDRVYRQTDSNAGTLKAGVIYTVREVLACGSLVLERNGQRKGYCWDSRDFAVIRSAAPVCISPKPWGSVPKEKPFKHSAAIAAWAAGEAMQFRARGKDWTDMAGPKDGCAGPGWFEDYEYRIKPVPKFEQVHCRVYMTALVDNTTWKGCFQGRAAGASAVDWRLVSEPLPPRISYKGPVLRVVANREVATGRINVVHVEILQGGIGSESR